MDKKTLVKNFNDFLNKIKRENPSYSKVLVEIKDYIEIFDYWTVFTSTPLSSYERVYLKFYKEADDLSELSNQ